VEEKELQLEVHGTFWHIRDGIRMMAIETYWDENHMRISEYERGELLRDGLLPSVEKWLEEAVIEGLMRRFFQPMEEEQDEVFQGQEEQEEEWDSDNDYSDHERYCDDGTHIFPPQGPIL
jgi:hypothetical protein